MRQGWALYAVMSILFLAGLVVCYWAEGAGNPQFASLGLDPINMEGKEVRFGIANSSLWAVATTDASNGSVNSMHDSFTPLGGMIPMLNIMLGEIIYGGVGSGLYGMLLFVIIAVFVAGLMVGRTPEYVGKKIEAKEVKMAMLAILILPLVVCSVGPRSRPWCSPSAWPGSPMRARTALVRSLYLYTSQTGNNGSAFAGITGNTLFYNTTGGLAMLDRTLLHYHPDDGGGGLAGGQEDRSGLRRHLPDHGGLFVGLLVGVILIVGGLSFFPALALGPIVEQLAMSAGTLF